MEDLNIERRIKQMVITRLNQKKTIAIAAASLGIHERTLHRYKEMFNIEWCEVTMKYIFKDNERNKEGFQECGEKLQKTLHAV